MSLNMFITEESRLKKESITQAYVCKKFKALVESEGQEYLSSPEIKLVSQADIDLASADMARIMPQLTPEQQRQAEAGMVFFATYVDVRHGARNDSEAGPADMSTETPTIRFESAHPIKLGMAALRFDLENASKGDPATHNVWLMASERIPSKYHIEPGALSEEAWVACNKKEPTRGMIINGMLLDELRISFETAGIKQPKETTEANIKTSWGSIESVDLGGCLACDDGGIYGIANSAFKHYYPKVAELSCEAVPVL